MTTTYRVTLSTTVLLVEAFSLAHAIRTALELAGPGAKVLSCIRQDEWA